MNAARLGDAEAQSLVGLAYLTGTAFYTIARNRSEAYRWTKKAAEQGNCACTLQIGLHGRQK